MKPPKNMTAIYGGKRYSTATATLLAGDDYWDGHNFERRGTNRFLYRTPKGAFFFVDLTQWQGQQDAITPVDKGDAIEAYEDSLTERRVPYEQAFPGVKIEDA